MATVWLDASYFIALINKRDKNHPAALKILARLKRHKRRTHLLVVGEVTAVVGSALGGKAAYSAMRGILDDCDVAYPNRDETIAAGEVVLRYDGKLSLSDALLLGYATHAEEGPIASFDRDFAGKADLF